MRDENGDSYSPYDLLKYYIEIATQSNTSSEESIPNTPQYLLFTAAGEGFMLDTSYIESVIREKPLIKVLPFTPYWLKGLVGIRGDIVSVVSFSSLQKSVNMSPDSGVNYILLQGKMKGFMLEVGDIFGLRKVNITSEQGEGFIDGCCTVDGKTWQRVNIVRLMETGMAQAEMDF